MPVVLRDVLTVHGLLRKLKFLKSKNTESSICHAMLFVIIFREHHMVSQHNKV